MTRDTKVEYAKQQLGELTPAQQSEIDKAIIWGSTVDFPKFIADAKTRFSNQATPEEISAVFNHLRV